MSKLRVACILEQATYKPGDQAPEGYLAWHEWAEVQHKAGLREYQPGAGQQHWHPTYGQLRAMPVERRPSAKRNPPDRQGDRNAFEQP